MTSVMVWPGVPPGGRRHQRAEAPVHGFGECQAARRPRVLAGDSSRRRAAVRTLGIGDGTLRRLLASAAVEEGSQAPT
ncbi:MAG TPA: hypothetical protein VGZ23_12470 [bacterium]|nr:hypothetical protein [bacterium]